MAGLIATMLLGIGKKEFCLMASSEAGSVGRPC